MHLIAGLLMILLPISAQWDEAPPERPSAGVRRRLLVEAQDDAGQWVPTPSRFGSYPTLPVRALRLVWGRQAGSTAESQATFPPYYGYSNMSAEVAASTQEAAALHFRLPPVLVLDAAGDVSIEMVLLPPGEFLMGGLLGPEETASAFEAPPGVFELEHPRHRVRLTRPFYVGRYEVTRQQWHAIMGGPRPSEKEAELPAAGVTWDEAQRFIDALSNLVDEPIHLITEAEWEYACRAGSTGEFSHAESLPPGLSNVDTDSVQPVGTFPPNAWGLHDMHGNVVEWVQDAYGGYPAADQTDPIATDHVGRMLRGGGYDREDWHARCSYRYAHLPSRGDQGAGFRIALTPRQNPSP